MGTIEDAGQDFRLRRRAPGIQIALAATFWAFLLCLPPALCATPAHGTIRGKLELSAGPHASILRNGVPYRAIGINYFDVFYNLLKHPDDSSFVEDFRQFRKLGIPFVRFAANGFWPADNELYFRDRTAYLTLLDRVVRAAEDNGLGLVPTLFWHYATVPDLVREPLSAWGDRMSRTHAFMQAYTEEILSRYRNSRAIWMWEFGNEYNDWVDLPRTGRFRPPVVQELGTPVARSSEDDLSLSMLMDAYSAFAATAHRLDPERLISAGNDITRENAAQRDGHRRGLDTRKQWTQMLLRQNEGFSVLSVHCYMNRAYFFRDRHVEVPGMFRVIQQIAVEAKKPVFVGEFGPSGEDREAGNAAFRVLLRAVEQSNVALAAVWNFSRKSSDGVNWNIDFTNENAWMLREVTAANERLRRAQGR